MIITAEPHHQLLIAARYEVENALNDAGIHDVRISIYDYTLYIDITDDHKDAVNVIKNLKDVTLIGVYKNVGESR